jgi:hypothetical protein
MPEIAILEIEVNCLVSTMSQEGKLPYAEGDFTRNLCDLNNLA